MARHEDNNNTEAAWDIPMSSDLFPTNLGRDIYTTVLDTNIEIPTGVRQQMVHAYEIANLRSQVDLLTKISTRLLEEKYGGSARRYKEELEKIGFQRTSAIVMGSKFINTALITELYIPLQIHRDISRYDGTPNPAHRRKLVEELNSIRQPRSNHVDKNDKVVPST